MSSSETPKKKTRMRRSPEKIADLILEAERKQNSAEIFRREGINPQQFSRWKANAKEGMAKSLKEMKGGAGSRAQKTRKPKSWRQRSSA